MDRSEGIEDAGATRRTRGGARHALGTPADALGDAGAIRDDAGVTLSEEVLGASPEGGEAPPKKRLRDRWLLLTILGVLAVVLVGGVAVVGYYGLAVLDGLNAVKRDSTLAVPEDASRPAEVTEAAGDPPINIVLIGSDTRGSERGRSDVLQLLHIPGDRSGLFLMSLPRDSWVDIPGRGQAKINAAYSYGGAPLTLQTMEQLLDVRMDHVAIIDFEGFSNVIEALGGVTVQNRVSTTSGDYVFPEGPVDLDGESALVYVRDRYNVPGGDFGRAERQRDVIIAVIQKLASGDTITDPAKFRNALIALGPNFTVDTELTNNRIFDLGWGLRSAVGSIRSMQLPVAGIGTSSDGQSIVLLDDAELENLREALRNDDLESFYAAHGA